MGTMRQTAAQNHVRLCESLQLATRSCRQHGKKIVASSKVSTRQGWPGHVRGASHVRAALMLDPGHQQTTKPAPQLVGEAPIFASIESDFDELLGTEDLDKALQHNSGLQAQAARLQDAVLQAIAQAYSYGDQTAYIQQLGLGKNPEKGTPAGSWWGDVDARRDAAHMVLQRILYKINRLVFFWYDDLRNYSNDRSIFLANLRDTIEAPWQSWELQQLPVRRNLAPEQIKDAIMAQAAYDVDPDLGKSAHYMRNNMSVAGYKYLLAVGSVDGLVEASRQSRVCAGAANEIMCAVFRVLMEEYGTGRFSKKHSTFYAAMMRELSLSDHPEDYLHLVPWQSLAAMNHNFLLTERRRHYLRYLGGLTFFEINGPSVYKSYLAAAHNLGLAEGASGYWALHIKEDERHGRQMVDEVALPLVDRYPEDAWEILLGYDQEKFMGIRAGVAVLKGIKAADEGALNIRRVQRT